MVPQLALLFCRIAQGFNRTQRIQKILNSVYTDQLYGIGNFVAGICKRKCRRVYKFKQVGCQSDIVTDIRGYIGQFKIGVI